MRGRSRRQGGEGWSFTPAGNGDGASGDSSPPPESPPEEHRLQIRVERRAKGKDVTVISPFRAAPGVIKGLEQELKKRCGVGGRRVGDAIELQGQVGDRAREVLSRSGWGLASP